MYLELLILRHLSRQPAHGYELRKSVEATTDFVLHNNSLYPALRRFEEAGAVVKTAHPQQGRPPKHVYEITGTGRELLHDLLVDLPVERAADEAEFLTRLGMFDQLTPSERRCVLDARLAALEARRTKLTGQAAQARAPWGAAIVAELLRRIDREVAWLQSLEV